MNKKYFLLISLILLSSTAFANFDIPKNLSYAGDGVVLYEDILNYLEDSGFDTEYIIDELSIQNKVKISCDDESITNFDNCRSAGYCEWEDPRLNNQDLPREDCTIASSYFYAYGPNAPRLVSVNDVNYWNDFDFSNPPEFLCLYEGPTGNWRDPQGNPMSPDSFAYFSESYFSSSVGRGYMPDTYLSTNGFPPFNELTYEEKCNIYADKYKGYPNPSANGHTLCTTTTGNSCDSVLYINSTWLKFIPSSDLNILQGEWIGSDIEIEIIENTIENDIILEVENFPDYEIKNNILPRNSNITLSSEKYDFLISRLCSDENCNSIVEIFANPGREKIPTVYPEGTYYLEVVLFNEGTDIRTDTPETHFYFFDMIEIEIKNMIYVDVETNVKNILPGQVVGFILNATTFDGSDIARVTFDPGQREESEGKIVVNNGFFECRISQTSFCSIESASVDGVPSVSAPCGCTPGTLYKGQFTANPDTIGFVSAFNGDSFSKTIPGTYPSKNACGPLRVCEVLFEAEDENGVKSRKIIELNLPAVQTCSGSYPNSKVGTNSSLYIGSINDGEETCQCNSGYVPTLDDTLTLALGSDTKSCQKPYVPPVNKTTTPPATIPTSKAIGQSNPTYSGQQNKPSNSQNTDILSNDSEEKGYGFLIFGLFIVLGAGTIGGFEYYERQKTGSFVNPLNKIKSLLNKKDISTDSNQESDYQISPIQKFITDARNAGENNDTIKQNLINSGWPEEEIDKYI